MGCGRHWGRSYGGVPWRGPSITARKQAGIGGSDPRLVLLLPRTLKLGSTPARQVIRHGREDSKVLMPNVSLHSQDKWALKGGTQAPMSGKPRPNTTEKGTALLSSLNISRQHGAYAKLTQRTETWLLEQWLLPKSPWEPLTSLFTAGGACLPVPWLVSHLLLPCSLGTNRAAHTTA